MAKQKIFSQVSVDELELALDAPEGTAPYLKQVAFAIDKATLESGTIDAPEQLRERVNPESDMETAIALYEAYPKLNPLEASSRGFWTYLTHVDLWDYMQKRFARILAVEDETSRREKIKDKWFLGDPSQGSLMRHPLAGLWWGVRLSVDDSRGDGKYDLSRILLRDLDFLTRTFGTYQLGRLPNAVKGILGYIYNHEEDFKSAFEPKMRHIMKHFNSIGGVLQLGCLPVDFYANELERTKAEWIEAKRAKPEKGQVQEESESSDKEPSENAEIQTAADDSLLTPDTDTGEQQEKKPWYKRIF